jgi:hypothetical protein
MIFLYTVLVLTFTAFKVVIARRAASLERKYSKVAGAALKQANEPAYKMGNSGKADVGATARRMLELGLLVCKRDALEGKCLSWRGRADKLGRIVTALRTWKGQKLPYTLGALDVWLVLYAIDRLGAGDWFGPRQVMDTVLAWLER